MDNIVDSRIVVVDFMAGVDDMGVQRGSVVERGSVVIERRSNYVKRVELLESVYDLP